MVDQDDDDGDGDGDDDDADDDDIVNKCGIVRSRVDW